VDRGQFLRLGAAGDWLDRYLRVRSS
jgi:hypothetical protein